MGSRNTIWQWPNETIWRKYCGFLDLSKEEFSDIQRELLQDELLLIHRSSLGQNLLRGSLPKTIGDFRQACRLTTYTDYRPFLKGHQESNLAESVFRWVDDDAPGRASRCVPYTKPGYETAVDNTLAALILSSAKKKEDVNLRPQDRMYWDHSNQSSLLGDLGSEMTQRFGFPSLPPPSGSEARASGNKAEFSWDRGMTGGLDLMLAPSSALAKLGEDFSSSRSTAWFHPSMFHPAAMQRLAKGYLKSKILSRKMMPKDFWAPKSLLTWQLDDSDGSEMNGQTALYWGKPPYRPYFCSEGGVMGLPGWNRKDVTLIPYSNFYEFIPEDEYLKSWQDSEYRPETVLFHELTEGSRYELVITNLHGMPFLRYRVGHLIKVIAQDDPEIGVRLPKIAFEGKCDQRLDRNKLIPPQEVDMWEESFLEQTGESAKAPGYTGALGDTEKIKGPSLAKRN